MVHACVQRVPIRSSMLASIGHDPFTSILEMEFRNGSIYRYFAVPRTVFERLIAAPSKGIYVNRFIRNRYPCERISSSE